MSTSLVVLATLFMGAPDSLKVGVSTSTVYFASAAEKAEFLSALEQSLGQALNVQVHAENLPELAGRTSYDVILLDAVDSVGAPECKPVRYATYKGAGEAPWAVVSRSATALADVAAKLVLPGESKLLRTAQRYWLLLDEPGIADRVEKAEGARDVRAAIAAVAAERYVAALLPRLDYSKLDAALSGLKFGPTLGTLPLPILCVNTKRPADTVSLIESKIGGASLPTIRENIDGWASSAPAAFVGAKDATRLRRAAIPRELQVPTFGVLELDLEPYLPAPAAPAELTPLDLLPAPSAPVLPDPTVPPPPAVAKMD